MPRHSQGVNATGWTTAKTLQTYELGIASPLVPAWRRPECLLVQRTAEECGPSAALPV